MSDPTPPRVLIAICRGEMARHSAFDEIILSLRRGPGSSFFFVRGPSIAEARNIAVRKAIEGGFTHLMFVDDDQIIKPDTLDRLLAHDLPIVSGLYVGRHYPFRPAAWWEWSSVGDGSPDPAKGLYLRTFAAGLRPVVVTGCGCLLIRVDLLVKMGAPWFSLEYRTKDQIAEDFTFFARVREMGVEVFVDLDTPVGHFGTVEVWPRRLASGEWITVLRSKDGEIPIPDASVLVKIGEDKQSRIIKA